MAENTTKCFVPFFVTRSRFFSKIIPCKAEKAGQKSAMKNKTWNTVQCSISKADTLFDKHKQRYRFRHICLRISSPFHSETLITFTISAVSYWSWSVGNRRIISLIKLSIRSPFASWYSNSKRIDPISDVILTQDYMLTEGVLCVLGMTCDRNFS